MGFYGNQFLIKENNNMDNIESILENAVPCNYELFIESCIDSSYFMDSLLEHFEIGFVNEAESKNSFKNMIDTMIEKIKKLWDSFIGKIKELIDNFKKKISDWYEEHNISRGLLKIALHGFDYSQIEQAKEKIKGTKIEKEMSFISLNINSDLDSNYAFQRIGIDKIIDTEISDINKRITEITKKQIGDAKNEYNTLMQNIKDVQEKINVLFKNMDDPDSINSNNLSKEYKLRREIRENDNKMNYDIYSEIVYKNDHNLIDHYFNEIKRLPDKSEFDELVKYVEDSKKRSNNIKFTESKGYFSIKHCKENIEQCKRYLNDIKKKTKYRTVDNHPDYEFPNKGDHDTISISDPKNVEFSTSIRNNDVDILRAKLDLQMSILNMKVCSKALAISLKTNFILTTAVFSSLVALRMAVNIINNDKVDLETGELKGKILSKLN